MNAHTLPAADPLREVLHNEVHARPPVYIGLPALVLCVAVLNDGVTRAEQCAHLRRLPGQHKLTEDALAGNFLQLRFNDDGYGCGLQWERHTEFTRYVYMQPLPADVTASRTALPTRLDADWLRTIPGRTIAAIELVMLQDEIDAKAVSPTLFLPWFDSVYGLVASRLGNTGHSWAVSDFVLRPDGFERILVIARPGTTPARAGRISQRLLEMEIYRLMALRGLPTAKTVGGMVSAAERQLADTIARLEARAASEPALLDELIALAAQVERAIAEHMYRFSATRAYETLVTQRLAELRQQPLQGMLTLGDFMQRRLSPAMATVASAAARLTALSERIARASDLLRTRVDIATEQQNQQLLSKLTHGQAMQLRLQTTVEGLSIAAISYYVVSLLTYGVKALKAAGVPINSDIATGALIPVVVWGVWQVTRRIHRKLNLHD